MKSRVMNLILIAGLLGLIFVLAGCDAKEGNEWERVVCEVELVNAGAPLLSAYVDAGGDGELGTDDDVYPIDSVPVLFRARPYSTTLTIPEDGANAWFHITSYSTYWTALDPGLDTITSFNVSNGMCDLIVPVNEQGEVWVTLVGRDIKEEAWFPGSPAYAGSSITPQANCHIVFTGHESGSDRQVTIDCGLMVTFVAATAGD